MADRLLPRRSLIDCLQWKGDLNQLFLTCQSSPSARPPLQNAVRPGVRMYTDCDCSLRRELRPTVRSQRHRQSYSSIRAKPQHSPSRTRPSDLFEYAGQRRHTSGMEHPFARNAARPRIRSMGWKQPPRLAMACVFDWQWLPDALVLYQSSRAHRDQIRKTPCRSLPAPHTCFQHIARHLAALDKIKKLCGGLNSSALRQHCFRQRRLLPCLIGIEFSQLRNTPVPSLLHKQLG